MPSHIEIKQTGSTGPAPIPTNNEGAEAATVRHDPCRDSDCIRSFMSNMSHRIDAPMNGVIDMLDLLLDSDLSSTQREVATRALASAEDLFLALNNMLDFSKIEIGSLTLNPISFDLVREVEAIATILTKAAENKGLELIVLYPPVFHRMMIGDPLCIRQVLTNLLSNAIKFTAKGRVVVDLKVSIRPNDRCDLHVSVTDTGIGLAAAQRDDIFNTTAPDDNSAVRQQRGTGGGLMLCKHLMDLMGGSIGVENHPDQGSTFWFALDLPLSPGALIGVRMLFVDGQADSRRALQEQLRQHGMRADGFATAADAITALEQAAQAEEPYRIAVLDHQMPGIDGETLGIALKSDPVYSDTLLVLLSTLSRASDAQRFAQSGFSAFLSKPVTTPVLLHILATLCIGMQSGTATPFLTQSNITISPAVTDDEPRPLGSVATNRATHVATHGDDELDAMRDMFGADFPGLAALYLADSPQRIAALFLASAESDAVKLGKAAHALSGSSASIGASALAALCKELEIRAKVGLPPDIMPRLAAIELAFAAVKLRLQSMTG